MILIGTAGWYYRDWRGVFYPPGLAERQWLGHYAAEFPFTELNVTFYRQPDRDFLAAMAARTPPGFLFFVKAYQGLTHKREEAAAALPPFREALQALAGEGRLAGVLAQFPNSFRKNDANRDHLRWLRAELPVVALVVEFRHREWVEDETTFHLLEEENISYACVDEPQFKALVPPIVRATAGPAYLRMHGRNYRKWWAHALAEERYDYLYSRDELSEWVPRLQALERQAGTVYVSFNNHRRGQAVVNGRMLKDLLRQPVGAPP